ncbi:hypothetical protein DAPPUDRAFT_343670 [Daphnia pulex]|uniref:Uncharacterized protein n=1 Tax=Daphnia pulex TaxID=6669 RepID=E9I6C2_DAPPU|nr:hypothetical protein DAPPUDRAFT_343670 [Daphnia pulex]|eukprot:EFX60458.1 hypothetical protein DAPPUDRAFT_343670 [Daphnia pulex]
MMENKMKKQKIAVSDDVLRNPLSSFLKGDTVKLKRGVKAVSDHAEHNNKTAEISACLEDIEGGLFLRDGLKGCRYWNVDDVLLLERKVAEFPLTLIENIESLKENYTLQRAEAEEAGQGGAFEAFINSKDPIELTYSGGVYRAADNETNKVIVGYAAFHQTTAAAVVKFDAKPAPLLEQSAKNESGITIEP